MVRSMRFAITAVITVRVATSALAAPLAPHAASPGPLLSDLAPSNVPAGPERSTISATRELNTRDFEVIIEENDKEDSLHRDDDRFDPVEHHHRSHSEEVVDHHRKQEDDIEAILVPITKHREELERRTMTHEEAAEKCRTDAAKNRNVIQELKIEIEKCEAFAAQNSPNKLDILECITALKISILGLEDGASTLSKCEATLNRLSASSHGDQQI
ncbi:hypothetical protein F5876DRAFT_73392 [Lentinula aff. lateritia]|uniref:Uncharacterized protein n=1 Tax=Lentinula aff. lateritia TaxID=2804960 RepID=A0ACC1UAA0_9AGAR|nr:hypothetical protein F5876DRAFT_73392 [Lentinula aff. lateritia]